jgi:hypothetical protein
MAEHIDALCEELRSHEPEWGCGCNDMRKSAAARLEHADQLLAMVTDLYLGVIGNAGKSQAVDQIIRYLGNRWRDHG